MLNLMEENVIDHIVVTEFPLVSIIILHFSESSEDFKYIINCIRSIRNSTYRNFELIVFDQGSTDGATEYISENFPNVKVVMSETNLGPTEGRNQAAKFAQGRYLVFLDDDTKVEPTWLEELVKAAQNSPPEVGIIGSFEVPYNKEVDYDGIHGVCDILGCSYGSQKEIYGIDRKYFYFETLEFALLVKSEVFKKIGGFDPRFFMSGGLDFHWRARLAGYNIINVKSAVVHHAVRLTKNIYTPRKVYFLQRNLLMTLMKNYDTKTLIFILPIAVTQLFVETTGFILFGRLDLAVSTVKGILWCFKHFKQNWFWHIKTQKIRKVKDREIIKKMSKKNLKALKFLRFLETRKAARAGRGVI